MVQENKNNSISHLSSAPTRAGFKKILALMGLMTFSTLTTQAAQPINNYIGTEQVAKSPTDSIKNKAEYDAEVDSLTKRIMELRKQNDEMEKKHKLWGEQRDMLM